MKYTYFSVLKPLVKLMRTSVSVMAERCAWPKYTSDLFTVATVNRGNTEGFCLWDKSDGWEHKKEYKFHEPIFFN